MEEAELSFRRLAPRPHSEAAAARLSNRDNGKAAPTASLATTEDSVLLALIGQGDENALAAIFDRYSRAVYSVALRVLRDPAAAEDVLQEVLMQVWRKPEALIANRGALGAWLAVASRDRSMDALYRRKASDSVEDLVITSSENLSVDAQRTRMMERAKSIISSLPMEQRKSLEMAFFDGLTHAEIAETTGDPASTVKSRLRTALLVLRKAMQS